ncbi:MAG: hypothetical protein M1812_004757 [Candelaria pacifica]|nr:MAG: hypothetical protein M1812_004757 [Candelaria pacifica]
MNTDQIADGTRSASTKQVLTQKFRRGSADTRNNDRVGDGKRTTSVTSTHSGTRKLTKTTSGLQAKLGATLMAIRPQPHQHVVDAPVKLRQLSATLADLFFALPNELQVQIFCELQFADILSLRTTSRSFLELITISQSPIVRHYIKYDIPAFLLKIYPSPAPSNARLAYLIGIQYRLRVCSSLAGRLADFFTAETYGHRTESGRQKFQPHRDRMWRRMIPRLFVIFHFLESYRASLTSHLLNAAKPLQGAERDNPQYLQIEIIDSHSPQTLLVVHEMYRLLLRSFSRKLRPPTYAGRLERSVRGWKKPPPSEDDIVKVLLAGGLPEVNRIFHVQTYAERRRSIEDFVRVIDSRQGQNLPGVDNLDSLTSSSDGYLHTHMLQRYFDSQTKSTSRTEPSFGKALSQIHPNLLGVWITSAEATLLAKDAVNSLDQVKSPNECINGLVGDDGNSDIAAIDLDALTLTHFMSVQRIAIRL